MPSTEIGNIQRIFKPAITNLVAGIIIGLLMIGGGFGLAYLATRTVINSRGPLPFFAEKESCWFGVALFGLVAIGIMIGGVFMIRWMWSLASLRIHVGDAGFAVSSRKGVQSFLWDQIVSVKETHLYERPQLLKGPAKLMLPKMKSNSYTVQRDDNESFAFEASILSWAAKHFR